MSNISIAEILKICGKWVESKPFAEFVAKKKGISERYAYILIKKAVANKEILRIQLENRTVLYGLPDFGPQHDKEKATERAMLIDALIGYHEPTYFRKLPENR